jgi:hypothetical protein
MPINHPLTQHHSFGGGRIHPGEICHQAFSDFCNKICQLRTHALQQNACRGRDASCLAPNPNVRFHFTPTRSSWLNQVETWFSILQGQSLNGTSFTAGIQRDSRAIRLDQEKGLSAQVQKSPYHSTLIPGTRLPHRCDRQPLISGVGQNRNASNRPE